MPGEGLGTVCHRRDAGIPANDLALLTKSTPHTCEANVQRHSVRQSLYANPPAMRTRLAARRRGLQEKTEKGL